MHESEERDRLTRQVDECRREISVLQIQLGEHKQALTGAEQHHEAAVRACDVLRDANAGLRTELAMLRRALAAEQESSVVTTELVATEQPSETELEQRAWELFVAAMGSEDGISPETSFNSAGYWLKHRDKLRKAAEPADRPRPTSPPPPKVNR